MTAAKAQKNLEDYALKVEKELESYFDWEIKNCFGVSSREKELSKQIWKHIKEHCLRPAKRVRAAFIYYGYKLFDGKNKNEILKASISVELTHSAILMFDDFMDQDNLRRGLPTTHKHFKKIHQHNKFFGDSLHFGESMAANTGIIGLSAGYQILAESNFPESLKQKALIKLMRGIVNTSVGQSFDMSLSASQKASSKDIVDLHHSKTAIYTYENPLHIGAILAGANDNDLLLISKHAIPAGIAFQLQDDILGMFGNSGKTGKSAHSDLKQGKMTLLIIKALENANKTQLAKLRNIWGNTKITEKEAKEARQIMIDTGSLDYSKNEAKLWSNKALLATKEMRKRRWNREAIEFLEGLAEFVIARNH